MCHKPFGISLSALLDARILCLYLLCCVPDGWGGESFQTPLTFYGAADASAAVALDEATFLVADDENNTLRIYPVKNNARPSQTFDLTPFLSPDPDHPEADIEGATRVGNRVYFITSHGRNKNGKVRSARYRFFAVRVQPSGSQWDIRPEGIASRRVVEGLLAHSELRKVHLDQAIRLNEDLKKKERERLAPKEDGLNIESLAAGPDGKLYIGLRNPRPRIGPGGRPQAVLARLANPEAVITQNVRPEIDQVLFFDFNSYGFRAMEYCANRQSFFMVGGGPDGSGGYAIYRWSGDPDQAPEIITAVDKPSDMFNPEALIVFPKGREFLLLSDTGSLLVPVDDPSLYDAKDLQDGRIENKALKEPSLKKFFGFPFLSD